MQGKDFNGDGLSDILWLRYDNIEVTNWLASPAGGFVSNDANALVPLNIMHTFDFAAAGDFNGDGRTDTFWLIDDASYFPALTEADGDFNLFGQVLVSFEKDATIAGAADFNGDGLDDLLWRKADGSLTTRLATGDGGFSDEIDSRVATTGANWQIAGFGDFNGDGREDILFFSDSGWIRNWLSDGQGGFVSNDENSLFRFTSWSGGKQFAIADFNEDGLDDLVIVTSFGEVDLFITYPEGAFYPGWGFGYVDKVPNGADFAGTGDFNGDGIGDVLWRTDDGNLIQWLGSGADDPYVFTKVASSAALPEGWEIAADGVFDVPAIATSPTPGQLYISPGSQTYGPVPGGDTTQVIGSNLSEKVTLAVDANVILDPSFVRGNDTIVILGNAGNYVISSGVAGITISSGNGAIIRIPGFDIGGGLNIRFNEGEVGLVTDDGGNSYHLSGDAGVQDITATAVAISSGIMTFG